MRLIRWFAGVLGAALVIGLIWSNLFGARAAFKRSQSEASLIANKQAAVLRLAPLGTPILQAKLHMESAGYACELQINQAWGTRQHLNYLWCDRSESAGGPVKRRWQIALVEKDQQVSEVLVSTGLIGP